MRHVEHQRRLEQILGRVRARRPADGFVSLNKGGVSHFVPDPHDPRHQDRKLDVRELVEILEIDVESRLFPGARSLPPAL